jgi:hypothetical protein
MNSFIVKNYTGLTITLVSSIDYSVLAVFIGNEQNTAVLNGDIESPSCTTLIRHLGPLIVPKTKAVEMECSIFMWPLLLKSVMIDDKCESLLKVTGLPPPKKGVLYLVDRTIAAALHDTRHDLIFPYTAIPTQVNTYSDVGTYNEIKK